MISESSTISLVDFRKNDDGPMSHFFSKGDRFAEDIQLFVKSVAYSSLQAELWIEVGLFLVHPVVQCIRNRSTVPVPVVEPDTKLAYSVSGSITLYHTDQYRDCRYISGKFTSTGIDGPRQHKTKMPEAIPHLMQLSRLIAKQTCE